MNRNNLKELLGKRELEREGYLILKSTYKDMLCRNPKLKYVVSAWNVELNKKIVENDIEIQYLKEELQNN